MPRGAGLHLNQSLAGTTGNPAEGQSPKKIYLGYLFNLQETVMPLFQMNKTLDVSVLPAALLN